MRQASQIAAQALTGGWRLFSHLRRVPILGRALRMVGDKLLPRDALTWAQIEHGHAEGLWILVNPRIGFRTLKNEAEERALVQHLCAGMTFYDLGANIGYYSLVAARLVGPTGHVVSIEPDPEIATRLRDSMVRNGFRQVTVVEKAVWSETGYIPFVRADSNVSIDRGSGYACSSPQGPAITVEAVSLDTLARSYGLPDFIKCDVEGAEAAVFGGAQGLLEQHRPILLVEMHSVESHFKLTEHFRGLGYACQDIDQNHVLAVPR